jgi:hypothetical protein
MEISASNTTTPSQPVYSWVGEPKQRGTFQILLLCLATMIICVWSAVHLDIPNTRHNPTRRFLIRVVWMLITLIAPEALLFLAINQRIHARTVNTRAAKYLQSQPMTSPRMLAREYNYTLDRAELDDVSTQKLALNNSSDSQNMAGDVSPCRATNFTAGVSFWSCPCVLCCDGWFQN